MLASRNEKVLQEVADKCRELGSDVLVIITDVTQTGEMISLANAARDWKGILDVWINNAGILAAGPFEETPITVHKQAIETNLIGYMNGAYAALPIFKAQGYGTLINNISIGGFLSVPFGAGYSGSKFGMSSFSEVLKAELVEWPDIRICDLFPAFLDTPGISHAANYTSKKLLPAPLIYDPVRLAQAMVKVAANPSSNTYVGSSSMLLKMGHALFPQLMTNISARVIRRYLKNAPEIARTDGNIFTTVDYGMSANGGFGLAGKPKAHRKYLAGGVLAGLAIGLIFFEKGHNNSK